MAKKSNRRPFYAGDELRKAHIGDVAVHLGEPPEGNPYRAPSLIGEPRKRALTAFKRGEDIEVLDASYRPLQVILSEYTFWFAPTHGGARRITRDEVDWETSGV